MPDCKGVYRLYLIAIACILAWWILLRMSNTTDQAVIENDFMNRRLFGLPSVENCCSGWKVSHFTLFFIIGILYPDCDLPAIIGGVAWELVEVAVSAAFKQEYQMTRMSNGKVEYTQNWWAGSFADIGFNIVGFYFGKLVARKTEFGKRCSRQSS